MRRMVLVHFGADLARLQTRRLRSNGFELFIFVNSAWSRLIEAEAGGLRQMEGSARMLVDILKV